MKFSVVIPIYNKLPHLDRSIDSVLNQTFKNFEILLIDDASTDGSSLKIKEFIDPRISIYTRSEPGPGGYAARNLGIEKAQGEWVAFLDADDEWFPSHLQKMDSLSLEFPNAHLMSSGYQLKNALGVSDNVFYKKNKGQGNFELKLIDYLRYCLSSQGPVWTSVACVRKDSPVAEELFPANLSAKRGGDLHAWLKIMCHHKLLAWSDHIGAIYHLESVNMVTKKANFSVDLMAKNVFNELKTNLSKKEKTLLRKYLNLRLKRVMLASKMFNKTTNGIFYTIYWKGDSLNALYVSVLSFLPLRFLKKFFKKNH